VVAPATPPTIRSNAGTKRATVNRGNSMPAPLESVITRPF
jgi:hypothetical protein